MAVAAGMGAEQDKLNVSISIKCCFSSRNYILYIFEVKIGSQYSGVLSSLFDGDPDCINRVSLTFNW